MRTAEPYAATADFLRDYTALLRLKLEREVAAAREQRQGRAEAASGDPAGCDAGPEIASRAARLEARVASTAPLLPAWRLAEAFGLSAVERDALLLLQAASLDERFGRVFAYLNDDTARRCLTAGLAWRLLALDAFSPAAHALFASPSALVQHDLVRMPAAEPGTPTSGRPLDLDERIAAYLMDVDALDERLREFVTVEECGPASDAGGFEPALRERLANLCALWQRDAAVTAAFRGPPGAGKLTAARHVARLLGRPLLVVDVARPPPTLPEPAKVWRLLRREQRLRDAVVYLRHAGQEEAILRHLAQDAGPWTIVGADSDLALHDQPGILRVEFPLPGQHARSTAWSSRLGITAGDPQAGELGGRFRLTMGQIEDAVSAAQRLAALREGPDATPDRNDLFEAARRQSATMLASLAQKVTHGHTWEDLVLPPAVLAKLKAIVGQVRNAPLVYEQWGFGAKDGYGRGLAALFSGPSGTGKTMSAGVIARALGLDLYKIDLATIVSKYIGETEKNLDRVFGEAMNANAVLFFDEADALFGKRSEVKDAHDRYANIEISYLLQKMEEYEGLAVLATNFGQNLDEAFNRRLQFIIDFPLPRAEDRLAIWRAHLPAAAPLADDIELAFLAQRFELTGGAIRNCVRTAAFAAAEDGSPIAMAHLVQAVAAELAKLGRPLQRSEFGEHYGSVTESRRGRLETAANGHGPG